MSGLPLGHRPGVDWVYVDVVALDRRDGLVIPLEVAWPDGRRWRVERVAEMRRSSMWGADGSVWSYRVVIGGRERELWHVPPRWRVMCGDGEEASRWRGMPEPDRNATRRRWGLRA